MQKTRCIRECLVATSQAAQITAAGQPLQWPPTILGGSSSPTPSALAAPRKSRPRSAAIPLWTPRWVTPRSTPRTSRTHLAFITAAGPNGPARSTATSPPGNGMSSSPISSCGKPPLGTCGPDHRTPCAHETPASDAHYSGSTRPNPEAARNPRQPRRPPPGSQGTGLARRGRRDRDHHRRRDTEAHGDARVDRSPYYRPGGHA
jgi:hypothetical protein